MKAVRVEEQDRAAAPHHHGFGQKADAVKHGLEGDPGHDGLQYGLLAPRQGLTPLAVGDVGQRAVSAAPVTARTAFNTGIDLHPAIVSAPGPVPDLRPGVSSHSGKYLGELSLAVIMIVTPDEIHDSPSETLLDGEAGQLGPSGIEIGPSIVCIGCEHDLMHGFDDLAMTKPHRVTIDGTIVDDRIGHGGTGPRLGGFETNHEAQTLP
jgi:hypothetical protein